MIKPVSRYVAAIAMCTLFATPLAAAPEPIQSDQIQGGRDLSARMTVPVTINGVGPYHFVVDTGAERTVLSRELAQQLTLAAARPVTMLSIAGSSEVQTAMVADMQITAGRSSLSDLEAPILSEAHLGAVGMLGIDSLQNKKVVMDFKAMRLSISDSVRSVIKAQKTDGDEIIVSARRRLGQLIMVNADIDGQSINVVIDSGSAVSIGNPELRRRLVKRGKMGKLVPIGIVSVTGVSTQADYGNAGRIRIGGVTIANMPIAFANADIFRRLGLDEKPALLLGMDVLQMFDRVSVDFANRDVRFLLRGDALSSPPPLLAGDVANRHVGA